MGSMARNLASIVTGDLEIDVRYTLAVALISGIALGCLVWYVPIDQVSHPVTHAHTVTHFCPSPELQVCEPCLQESHGANSKRVRNV